MGWTFYRKPVGVSAVESLKEDALGAEWVAKHVIASSATWGAAFFVVKRHDPESDVYVPDADGFTRGLAVFKIRNTPRARDGYNFGYKDMSESMGPYGCEAPLSILAQCSALRDPIGPQPEYSSLRSATEYRARCHAKAAAKAIKRRLKPGNVVTLAKSLKFAGQDFQTFTVERTRVRGRKGMSTVFRAPTGMLCGIGADDLVGAVIQ
jgi:hypothetical protein